MGEVDAGPSELFRAAEQHAQSPTLALTAIAVALNEVVKIGYSIDERLRQIIDRLEIGNE